MALVPVHGRIGHAWSGFVGVQSRVVTPGKILKFLMQILAFWRTFSQKINSCESAKYHTFPFPAALRAPSTR